MLPLNNLLVLFTYEVNNRNVYKGIIIIYIMVNNKILRRKFIGDIPEEEMQLIEKACVVEKRTRTSLIRKAATDYARKILREKEDDTTIRTTTD